MSRNKCVVRHVSSAFASAVVRMSAATSVNGYRLMGRDRGEAQRSPVPEAGRSSGHTARTVGQGGAHSERRRHLGGLQLGLSARDMARDGGIEQVVGHDSCSTEGAA